jgi:hypothetical protein
MAIKTGADRSIAELETRLRQARTIQHQINRLQERLDLLVGGTSQAGRRGKRRMSAAARARIAAAQRARWAKQRGSKTTGAKRGKRKRRLTAAGRKKLSDMMKARWAARRKAKP